MNLNRVYIEESNVFVHTNEKMFRDNVLIEEMTYDNSETVIHVLYFNDFDATSFTMYWGNLLAPIQIRLIIKEIYELYNENTLTDFLAIIEDISETHLSASDQTSEISRISVINTIKEVFESYTNPLSK